MNQTTTKWDYRKFFLNLKTLIWCLNRASTKYHLPMVIEALERRAIPKALEETNLGDNIAYLLEVLDTRREIKDLIEALRHSSASLPCLDCSGEHLELPHYLRAARPLGEAVPPGTFGLAINLQPDHLEALFYCSDKGFTPISIKLDDVELLYGTLLP